MDFIGIALAVALVVVAARSARKALKRRRFRALRAGVPGYSADHPAILSSPQVIDALVRDARCECGGRVRNTGETPRLGLRVVRGRCEDCDGDVELYLVLPKLLN